MASTKDQKSSWDMLQVNRGGNRGVLSYSSNSSTLTRIRSVYSRVPVGNNSSYQVPEVLTVLLVMVLFVNQCKRRYTWYDELVY